MCWEERKGGCLNGSLERWVDGSFERRRGVWNDGRLGGWGGGGANAENSVTSSVERAQWPTFPFPGARGTVPSAVYALDRTHISRPQPQCVDGLSLA